MNAPVMYADSAGAHLKTLYTNADGRAVIDDVPEGGSVTVLRRKQRAAVDLFTFAQVPYGSALQVEAPQRRPEPVGTIAATYSNPSAASVALLTPDRALLRGDAGALSATAQDSWLSADGTLDLLAVTDYGEVSSQYQVRQGLIGVGQRPSQVFSTSFDTWTTPVVVNALFDHDEGGVSNSLGAFIQGVRRGLVYDLAGYTGYTPLGEQMVSLFVYPPYTDHVRVYYHVPVFESDNTRYHTFPAIPAPGGKLEFRQATSELFPGLGAAVFDFDALTFDSGWETPPTCATAVPKAVHVTFRAYNSTASTWELWGPYSRVFKAPELDPAVTAGLWPGNPVSWESHVAVIGLSQEASYEDLLAVLPSSADIPALAEEVCFSEKDGAYVPNK